MAKQKGERADEFVQLWTRHSRSLYVYIMTLVFKVNLAEDILQETAIAAWKEFDNFTTGSNFKAWASKIAYYRAITVLRQRKAAGHEFHLQCLELLAEDATPDSPDPDRRFELLHECLQALKQPELDLLSHRYGAGDTVSSIAKRLNKTDSAIYKMLEKVHRWLFDCVTRKLNAESA